MSFKGFGPGALGLLGDLAEHNDREWFAANKECYERDLLDPERDFVNAIGTAFASRDERVQAVPAVDKSIFRIHRDIRFSKDKSPYKTYSDMFFWVGSPRKSAPGYFLRLSPGEIWVGCGAHSLTDEQLRRYRVAVLDGLHGQWLEHIFEDLTAKGYEIGESTLKRVPAGFDAQHPRADYLKFTVVHAIAKVSPPPEMAGPEFVDWCMAHFIDTKPLVDWLAEQLGGAQAPDMRL
jgi:uncharacterized protein (TIGR02453 family)